MKTVKLAGRSNELGSMLAELYEKRHRAMEDLQKRYQEEAEDMDAGFNEDAKKLYEEICQLEQVDPKAGMVLDVSYSEHGDLFLKEPPQQPFAIPENMVN